MSLVHERFAKAASADMSVEMAAVRTVLPMGANLAAFSYNTINTWRVRPFAVREPVAMEQMRFIQAYFFELVSK